MRSTMVLARSLIALSAAASALGAQSNSARDALLVTPGWLSTHLKDANLVILHVGVRENYAAKHIPGARYIDMMDVSVSDFSGMGPMPAGIPTPPIVGPKNGLSLEMPTAEQLRSQLAKFGISDDSRIVICKADDYVSPSTRIAFTLDYAGLGKNTVMLDGGLPAWIANGGEVSDVVVPAAQPGKLSPLTLRPIVVDAEFVRDRASKPGMALIDARAPMFWAGTPPSTGGASGRPQPPPGHIPGATNIPFDTVMDDAGKLKSPDELAAMFTRAGVKPGDTIVAYCHVGGQATTVLLAARTLGHPVLLYDGSMNDWNKRGNALELPEKAKP